MTLYFSTHPNAYYPGAADAPLALDRETLMRECTPSGSLHGLIRFYFASGDVVNITTNPKVSTYFDAIVAEQCGVKIPEPQLSGSVEGIQHFTPYLEVGDWLLCAQFAPALAEPEYILVEITADESALEDKPRFYITTDYENAFGFDKLFTNADDGLVMQSGTFTADLIVPAYLQGALPTNVTSSPEVTGPRDARVAAFLKTDLIGEAEIHGVDEAPPITLREGDGVMIIGFRDESDLATAEPTFVYAKIEKRSEDAGE